MGKHLRKQEAKLNARIKACLEGRKIIVARSYKLRDVIEKAQRLPGSRKLK